jgi:hypothetical protein
VVFRQKNPVLAQSYFKLAYSALACNKKGSSGSASFHSARKSWYAVWLCRLWYGAAESKSTRGKAAQQALGRFDFYFQRNSLPRRTCGAGI